MKRAALGFTLLEIMITLVIIAVIAGLAVLALPQRQAAAYVNEQAALLFDQLSEFKTQIMMGQGMGAVVFDTEGYAFYRVKAQDPPAQSEEGLNEGAALATEEKSGDTLEQTQRFTWPVDIEADFRQETNTKVQISRQASVNASVLLFFENGDQIPFRLSLQDQEGHRAEITGGSFGGLTFSPQEEETP